MRKRSAARVVTEPETIVMALDPGFANLGVAILRVTRDDVDILKMDVKVTKKSQLKVTVNEDNLSRNRELSKFLNDLIDLYGVTVLAYEAYSMPQMSSKPNLVKIGFPYGILAALGEVYGLATIMRTPQAVKKAVCGGPASKEAIEAALKARFALDNMRVVREFERKVPAGRRNHAWDALGAFVAAEQSDVMRALRGR